MKLFEFSGVPLSLGDMQNVEPGRQYAYSDLRPYTRSPEDEAEYARCLRPYRMFPERPLDERFADFKVRLADAIKKRAVSS